jgi:predicted amidophosphoribosyltransferase
MILQTRCAGCDRAGAVLCRTCRFSLVGPAPHVTVPGVVAAVPFAGRARNIVLGLKYANRRTVARHLAGVLVNRLLAAGVRPAADVDVVTWAPTSGGRRHRRGYDQAELVARHVAHQLGVPARPLLQRGGGTPQTGLGRAARLVGPPLRARPDAAGRRVLVVDDVVTTGGTLRAARHALLGAGATDVRLAAVAATPAGTAGGRVLRGPWPQRDGTVTPARRSA